MEKSEGDFRRWIASVWGGWVDFHEPGLGTTPGYPDATFMMMSKRLLPAELKIAPVVKDGHRFMPERVRPAQVGWHSRFANAGGVACLIVGHFHSENWQAILVDGCDVQFWKDGYSVHQGTRLLDAATFSRKLTRWYTDVLSRS